MTQAATSTQTTESASALGSAPNPAAAAPVGAASASSSAGAAAAKTWHDSLPEDIRGDASLKTFADVESLAKSYVHLNKTQRSEKIAKPNQYFTDDDWKKTFQALGLPETIDKYDIKVPENANPDTVSKLKEAAHKAGVLPKQFQSLLETFTGMATEEAKAKEQSTIQARAAGIDGLKKEWGPGFDKEVYSAKVAVEEFGGDSLRKVLVSKGLDNDPDMIRLFSKIGKSLTEDKIKGNGTTNSFGKTPGDAQTEANSIIMDKAHPYNNALHPNHKKAVEDVNKLYQIVAASQMPQ